MARITPREYTITVNTFSELFALTNLSDNMNITCLDASGDVRSNGGTVVYTYLANKSGVDAFIIDAQEFEENIVVEQETNTIANGKVTLSYTPSNGILLECKATWVDNGVNFVEDVIYNLSGLDVVVDAYYNGKQLVAKYLRNDSGKLVSTVVQDGLLHTHSNKNFLDTLNSMKTINGESVVGSGNITISGGTAGYGLSVGSLGELDVDTTIIATKDDIANFSSITSYNDLTDVPSSFVPSAHSHTISDVTGLQAELDAMPTKVSDLTNDSGFQTGTEVDSKISIEKNRIDAILLASDANADTFAEVVSLINSVDTTNDTAFAGYVLSNDATVAGKVDKVSGKGLSTEDYTTTEKTKLSGIASGAQVNTVDSVAGKTGVVALVKGDVGLGNVDNTTDLLKPISTATQTALDLKQDDLVSGTNIKTINGSSILGSGDIVITGGGASSDFQENSQLISYDYTLAVGKNASITGPVEVATGYSIVISDGARLVIL